MIQGFEEYTEELDHYERTVLLPLVVQGMETKKGNEMAITNDEILKALRGQGYKISAPRLRKILHVVRVSGMVEGIVASSKGYYIAQTTDEWSDYIKSLTERVKHIESLRDAIADQFDNWQRKYQ